MLRNTSEIRGYAIAASDGELGTVSDLLFDDTTWLVRWLVVETGDFLSGRQVLLPASVLGPIDPDARKFSVRLTMEQVKKSPDIDTDLPVSRQHETDLYGYYGWCPYWDAGFFMGGYGYVPPSLTALHSLESRRDEEIATAGDQHLRSTNAVTGYHIHATDGEIGHASDFLVEDADWSIRYLVVDTSNWWLGKKVLISPRSAEKIDWLERRINLGIDRQRIKNSPLYDASTTVDRAYEKEFHAHYSDGMSIHAPSSTPGTGSF